MFSFTTASVCATAAPIDVLLSQSTLDLWLAKVNLICFNVEDVRKISA